ncbi:MAG: SpoIIE family protein phosphatase [Muribaculaceae bacterium]|nr:SpoIIE family protein phosphatase [Muribaculaceae bacterium]
MKMYKFKSFATRLSVFTTFFAVTIFVALVYFIYIGNKKVQIDNAINYTHSLLDNMTIQIRDRLNMAEDALISNKRIVEKSLTNERGLSFILKGIVLNNDVVIGSSLAFAPNQVKGKGEYYMIYAMLNSKDSVDIKILQDKSYDYHSMNWYRVPKANKQAFWSEPYYDKGAGDDVMSTYSLPLFDDKGDVYAIFTVDVSLTKLSELVENLEPIPNSYSFMLSRNGYYVTHKNRDRILHETIFTTAESQESEEYSQIGYNMVTGLTGTAIFNNDGEESMAFYTSIPEIGWSLCNVCPSSVILAELNYYTFALVIILLIATSLLFFCIFRVIKRLSRPLEEFSKSVSEISHGNFMAELPKVTSEDEMKTLHTSFENMQVSLVKYTKELKRTAQEQQRIESELQIARTIQQGMLPKIFPPFPERNDLDLSAQLKAAKEVGGDLYNFFIENERLYFMVGDVSGKGIPASLVMAITSSIFNTVSHGEDSPKNIMTKLNKAVCSGNDTNMFVTVFVGILDLNSGEMRICNAGHNPPLVLEPNKPSEYLKLQHNLPIGVIPEFKFKEEIYKVSANTTMVLYTDGITEAENAENELYGEQRLKEILETNKQEEAKTISEKVLIDVSRHAGITPQSDDITLLVLKYNPIADTQFLERLVLGYETQEITKLEQFIETLGQDLNLDFKLINNINLALEEAVANVIMYSKKENTADSFTVEVTLNHDKSMLTFIITDSGEAFDPTQKREEDINVPLEERKIGGLGIVLIKKIMDSISYQRKNGNNILILNKNIT